MKTTPKKNGGFTLVELIVVIAILAILAAVAIPAYSGYIAKAEKAGDLQILGAVNSAFAAACADNGFTQYEVKGAMIPIAEDGTIGNGTVTLSANPSAPKFIASLVRVDGASVDLVAFNTSFALFFSGNENAVFKTIESGLFFDPTEGGFVALEDYEGDVTVSYKGVAFEVSGEVAAQLAASVYGEMGAGDLTAAVGDTSTLIGAALQTGNAAATSLAGPEHMTWLFGKLGIEPDEWEDYISDKDANSIVANSLILRAADNTTAMTSEESAALLSSLENGSLSLTKADGTYDLTSLGASYALYTAYAERTGKDTDKATGISALEALMGEDEDFQKYVKEHGTEDLAAYQSAMGVVSNATGEGNTDTAKDILVNGFTDQELQDLLSAFIGK